MEQNRFIVAASSKLLQHGQIHLIIGWCTIALFKKHCHINWRIHYSTFHFQVVIIEYNCLLKVIFSTIHYI